MATDRARPNDPTSGEPAAPRPCFDRPSAGDAWARLVRLAARVASTPYACIEIAGPGGPALIAAWGFSPAGRPADRPASGSVAVPVVANDATLDARLASHPWVAGAPRARFVVAVAIPGPDGRAPVATATPVATPVATGVATPVGTLWVLDPAVRPAPDPADLAALADLAAVVGALWAERARVAPDGERSAVSERHIGRDAVTGVLNPRGLAEGLSVAVALARRSASGLAVALLEMEGWGAPTRTDGSFDEAASDDAPSGDALRAVARRLVDAVRDEDLVARTGPAEFAVVLQGIDASTSVVVAARLVAEVLATRPPVERARGLRVSAGVAGFPADAEDAAGLLRSAAVALARARAAGGGALAYVPDPR